MPEVPRGAVTAARVAYVRRRRRSRRCRSRSANGPRPPGRVLHNRVSCWKVREVAARTVNKERARSGESKTSRRDPKAASQRGGQRSHGGVGGQTKDQLYQGAEKGRSGVRALCLRAAPWLPRARP